MVQYARGGNDLGRSGARNTGRQTWGDVIMRTGGTEARNKVGEQSPGARFDVDESGTVSKYFCFSGPPHLEAGNIYSKETVHVVVNYYDRTTFPRGREFLRTLNRKKGAGVSGIGASEMQGTATAVGPTTRTEDRLLSSPRNLDLGTLTPDASPDSFSNFCGHYGDFCGIHPHRYRTSCASNIDGWGSWDIGQFGHNILGDYANSAVECRVQMATDGRVRQG
ncbi:hypothetical protein B0H14DRAFT_2565016 [Mycena olivaceomarginata]|nr:hypothetical protein B0H14DRAFT_2565016 [Mycena olivaceomarginata]